ncbi:MAG: 50S ribosomal protein L4 [Nitrososphaeraceae archaeon]
MKAKVLDLDRTNVGSIELPQVFLTPYHPAVIHKTYVSLLSHSFQAQGRYPYAGEIVSAESRNTGLGIARIARAKGQGFPRAGQAAGVAGVRHGRVAHPPVSFRRIYKKINKKEKILALCSAIAATSRRDLVTRRGHELEESLELPLVVSNKIESIDKANDLNNTLIKLGLKADLDRAKSKNRTVRGTSRRHGRSSGVSVLLVVSRSSNIMKLSRSLAGVNVKPVDSLNVMDLLPGSKPIRLTMYSQNAIESLVQFNGLSINLKRNKTE